MSYIVIVQSNSGVKVNTNDHPFNPLDKSFKMFVNIPAVLVARNR